METSKAERCTTGQIPTLQRDRVLDIARWLRKVGTGARGSRYTHPGQMGMRLLLIRTAQGAVLWYRYELGFGLGIATTSTEATRSSKEHQALMSRRSVKDRKLDRQLLT